LAPGAQTLVKKVTDPDDPLSERIDPKKLIRHLTVDDWKIIIRAFHNWPFAPRVRKFIFFPLVSVDKLLMQDLSITDTFSGKDQR
jgi:transcription factor 1